MRQRRRELGRTVEIVVAGIALAVAIVALVVALTREPSSKTTAGPATSTTTKVRTTMPSVLGMRVGAATQQLQNLGLQVETRLPGRGPLTVHPPGTIEGQMPVAGARLPRGATVTLLVSR